MIPSKLKTGDFIGIVAPSAPVTTEIKKQFDQGVKFLESLGFNVKIAKNTLSNKLVFSNTPIEKAEDINYMFVDKEIKAIICAQGGRNSNSILPYLDFDIIRANPKIFLGISDITVLLNAIYQQTGLITFHGNDIMWGFGVDHSKYDVQEFQERLINGNIGKINKNSEWKTIRKGIAEGILIGGNLKCFNKLAGTKYLPEFENKILFLESFDGSALPDEVDCEIHHLKQIGVFEKIKGLWIGYYNHKSGIKYEDIILEALKEYSFPILKCDDFGHNTPNTTIPLGVKIKLDSTDKEVSILDTCVT